MSYNYSFVVDLLSETPFKKKFLTGDGTEWKVRTRWRFKNDEGSSSELASNLVHVVFIQQMNHFEIFYEKAVEAYPMEVSNYSAIEKIFNGSSFSISLRDYTNAFRPTRKEPFQVLGFRLKLTPIPVDNDCEHASSSLDCEYASFPCLHEDYVTHKRYDYLSILNMSHDDVKVSAADAALRTIINAIQEDNDCLKTETIEYISKNFKDFENTDTWRNFACNHAELYAKILGMVIEHMSEESDKAGKVLYKTISKWDINSDT